MGRLVYSAICSLDGYIADEGGGFDWAVPDDEVHAFVNDLERPIGTYLYGRRMYEVMAAWQSVETGPPVAVDFARIWRSADKVVYSRTLDAVTTPRTTLERSFERAEVIAMKATSARDLSVGGAGLAAAAFAEGLVDECHLLLAPAIVGGGTRALPDGIRVHLALRDERRFTGGFVHLHYAVRA
jgi:dihydrofolate reductase